MTKKVLATTYEKKLKVVIITKKKKNISFTYAENI